MKTKILITGAAGYLGSLLSLKLSEEGHKITAVDLPEKLASVRPLFSKTSIELISGDAADDFFLKEYLPQTDIVIPLAAIVGAPACDLNPEIAKRVNLSAIQNLNRLRSRDQLVIFPMTNNGYRPEAGQNYVTEETPFKADSLYTLTKLQAEEELMSSSGAISFRLASLFGSSPAMRWDLLLHHFVQHAFDDGSLSVYESDFKRNFVHALDAVDCILHGIQNQSKMNGQIYNLALDSANISKQELALEIKKYLPHLKIEKVTGEKDPDARNFFISTQKLAQSGFKARRSLQSGINEILTFLQMQNTTLRRVS